jgi:hypothetical protein
MPTCGIGVRKTFVADAEILVSQPQYRPEASAGTSAWRSGSSHVRARLRAAEPRMRSASSSRLRLAVVFLQQGVMIGPVRPVRLPFLLGPAGQPHRVANTRQVRVELGGSLGPEDRLPGFWSSSRCFSERARSFLSQSGACRRRRARAAVSVVSLSVPSPMPARAAWQAALYRLK